MDKQKVKSIISDNKDLFDYGSSISEEDFCNMFGVQIISEESFKNAYAKQTKQQVRQALEGEELAKLSVFGVVMDVLHESGKHFQKHGRSYIVALPHANQYIADRYARKASRALAKAKKLLDNTPYIDNNPENKTQCNSMVALLGDSADRLKM